MPTGTLGTKVTVATGRLEFSQRHERPWTADGSGDFDRNIGLLGGSLMKVAIVPDAGATQPDDNFSVQLLDENGVDLLNGLGAAIDNGSVTILRPAVPITDGVDTALVPNFICNDPRLVIAGAGANNAGKVILYMR